MSDLYGEQYMDSTLDDMFDAMDNERDVQCPSCLNWNLVDQSDLQCMCGHCGHIFTVI
jgi:hypothetical protein